MNELTAADLEDILKGDTKRVYKATLRFEHVLTTAELNVVRRRVRALLKRRASIIAPSVREGTTVTIKRLDQNEARIIEREFNKENPSRL